MRRDVLACVGAAAIAAISLPAVVAFPTKLIWNASPSAPIGLYDIRPVDRLAVGDLVAVEAPEPLARFIAERGYLPPDIPLLKHVVALPGQTVCRRDRMISVDGVELGNALDHDRMGRPMPVWRGCHRIAAGDVFLMNRDAPASLDGRYFGPIAASSVIGTAVPLWTDADGAGGPDDPQTEAPSTASRKDLPMTHIGHFNRTGDGYAGRLRTLTLDADLTLVPAEPSDSENAPDYRIHIGEDDAAQEIGAGWRRTGEKAGDYVSVLIDDPPWAHPIHANLFRSTGQEGAYLLNRNRRPKRRDRA